MLHLLGSRLLRSALIVFGLAVVVSGCRTAGVNIAEIDSRSKKFAIQSIGDEDLQDDYAPIVNGKALYQEQLMQAVVEVHSKLNRTQKYYYKWNWFDADEFPLAEGPWQFVVLNGDEQKLITGTAPQPRAVRCQFLWRRPSTKEGETK